MPKDVRFVLQLIASVNGKQQSAPQPGSKTGVRRRPSSKHNTQHVSHRCGRERQEGWQPRGRWSKKDRRSCRTEVVELRVRGEVVGLDVGEVGGAADCLDRVHVAHKAQKVWVVGNPLRVSLEIARVHLHPARHRDNNDGQDVN